MAMNRQMAAGDQLRVVYDQLSRDPASLSNLDQDLPNYSQHSVPIFSLPQARVPHTLMPTEIITRLLLPLCVVKKYSVSFSCGDYSGIVPRVDSLV